MSIDHREVSVKVVKSVADESARFRFDNLVIAIEVENDQAVYPLSWVDFQDLSNKFRCTRSAYKRPSGPCTPTYEPLKL